MKVMLYSQHVLGIGHFFRSMEIAGALHRHRVLFAEGGDPLPAYVPPAHVERLLLPSLMMSPDFKAMEFGGGSLEEVKLRRKEVLMDAFLRFSPDVLMTELFPFGRKQFRSELMPLLEAISQRCMPTRVVCSLRDILVEKADSASYEKGVLDILNTHYHMLLVHSDPRVTALDETFERVADIRVPIRYTGFVARRPPRPRRGSSGRTIVASSGGGKVGGDLLGASIQAVHGLPDSDLRLRVFMGPFMEKIDTETLEAFARDDSRITLHPFSLDFQAELLDADLSISMAGYNTCMDILSAGVRSLVYPFSQNREQGLRAQKLQALGCLRVLEGLDVEALRWAIRRSLAEASTPVHREIDLSGALNTALIVEKC